MSDLMLDLAAVTDLGSTLTTVADEFENANTRSDHIAAATGDDVLAEAVRSFARGWDDRRAKMTADVRALSDAATTVAKAFADVDTDLARAVAP